MDRAFLRRASGLLVSFVSVVLVAATLSACTSSDHQSSPSPQTTTSSSVPTAPVQSAVPSDEPTPTPVTTWTPPADPGAEGPTAAPELPTQEAPLDEPVELTTGVTVAIDRVTTTDIKPETPGEYAGSAVVVSVSVRNDSDSVQSVDSAVVMLSAADGEVGIATTAGPNRPLQGNVPVGGKVEGSYVFMLEPAKKRKVTVTVNYAAGEPVVEFTGSTA